MSRATATALGRQEVGSFAALATVGSATAETRIDSRVRLHRRGTDATHGATDGGTV